MYRPGLTNRASEMSRRIQTGDERSNIQLSTVCHVPQDVDPLPDVDVSGTHVDLPEVVLASPIWTTACNNGFTAQAEAGIELRQL